jgi:hypothetical protein
MVSLRAEGTTVTMFRVCLAVAMLASAPAALAQPQEPSAAVTADATEAQVLERGVRALYVRFFPGTEDPGALALPFSDELAALEAEAAKDEAGIPFDFYCDCQDYEMTDLSVVTQSLDAQGATLVARFRNFGKDTRVTFKLIKTPAGWRIDDVITREGGSQRAIFAGMAK